LAARHGCFSGVMLVSSSWEGFLAMQVLISLEK
jgi:hypothetical protein